MKKAPHYFFAYIANMFYPFHLGDDIDWLWVTTENYPYPFLGGGVKDNINLPSK